MCSVADLDFGLMPTASEKRSMGLDLTLETGLDSMCVSGSSSSTPEPLFV